MYRIVLVTESRTAAWTEGTKVRERSINSQNPLFLMNFMLSSSFVVSSFLMFRVFVLYIFLLFLRLITACNDRYALSWYAFQRISLGSTNSIPFFVEIHQSIFVIHIPHYYPYPFFTILKYIMIS